MVIWYQVIVPEEWRILLIILLFIIFSYCMVAKIFSNGQSIVTWYLTFCHRVTVSFYGDPTTKTDAYIINTYYYPVSKSLGENALAMVLLMDRNTVRDITRYQMKLIATNKKNQQVMVVPDLVKEQINDACRYVNVVATTNVIPDLKKLEISDGETKMEIPFKLPRQHAPSPVIICISPQFIGEQWQTFLAHVHVARRFGGHLHIYVTSLLDSFFELLNEYEKMGFITTDFWMRMKFLNGTIDSLEPNSNTELRNQAGAQTDCLLQYKEAASFITFFDLDDILFPRGYDSYFDEFTALHAENPGILTFHYNKREIMVHNKANIQDINFLDLFNHTWFVNEEDYGKTMTKPTSINSMWMHETFSIPYSKKLVSKKNHLVHLQKPVDSDGKESIPYRLSSFERMPDMKLNDTVLVEIQQDFQRLLNSSSNISIIAQKLPKLSYYFPIIYRCYYEKFYKKFQLECPNGEGCIVSLSIGPSNLCIHFQIPQRSDLNCVHSEVDYKSGPPMKPITYHYHENPRWIRTIGCHS
ncbi:hypothetical protein CAEBREN_31282 [Caenorhabditis brenneri]|uniref:Glycosyltransferase family 92 protein n=1 Tax=Caenorhabditis brenneri TaxID=135651 RepID=G0PFW3_CAEBE|nr:hypothetical protein CAEBREN_31282 [Caenorhabditis brenneri]